mgnify:CR=1 FL=1|jgi:hypothetical protein
MPDPRVPQGNLNRIKASLLWTSFPQLNVTASYLGREGLSLSFEGSATGVIPTMTGLVNSPEAFQSILVSVHLLKTQPLCVLYEQQRQTDTLLGDGTIRPDVNRSNGGLGAYDILNMSIRDVSDLSFNGSDDGYRVQLGGYIIINSALWDG